MTRLFDGAPWRLIVTDTAMRTLSCLDHKATGRQFLFTLNGPAYTTGQVASDDPEINIPFPDPDSPALLTQNRRLLFGLRREPPLDPLIPPYVCRFSGIITNLEDQGADTPTSRYTAYDPWQYMMSRPARNPDTGELLGPDGYTFPAGTRASEIAVGFLLATETVDGETYIDLGGTELPLVEPTDPLADPITFSAGLSVGEAWQQLCATGTIDIALPPIYEPVTNPAKIVLFQTAKRLGSTRFNAVMGWDKAGRSLTGIDRLIDGTRMANEVQYFSGQSPATLQSDADSIAAYGEWWAQQFFPDASPVLVELLALADLEIRKNGATTISFDPTPERTELALRDYGPGDYLPVWASRNLRQPISPLPISPLFCEEGPDFYDAAFAHNSPFAVAGPYQTPLTGSQETNFRLWLTLYSIPFDPDEDPTDYDMRGYWLANGGTATTPVHVPGDHFPDTFKTPYDTSFSAESQYATGDCPFHWDGDFLIDARDGSIVFGPCPVDWKNAQRIFALPLDLDDDGTERVRGLSTADSLAGGA